MHIRSKNKLCKPQTKSSRHFRACSTINHYPIKTIKSTTQFFEKEKTPEEELLSHLITAPTSITEHLLTCIKAVRNKEIALNVNEQEYEIYHQDYHLFNQYAKRIYALSTNCRAEDEALNNELAAFTHSYEHNFNIGKISITKQEYPYLFAYLCKNNISYVRFLIQLLSPILDYFEQLIDLQKDVIIPQDNIRTAYQYNTLCCTTYKKNPSFLFWQIYQPKTALKRINFALSMINAIIQKYHANPTETIHYTAFLDDGLLQTATVLQTLVFLGFNTLHLNLVIPASSNNQRILTTLKHLHKILYIIDATLTFSHDLFELETLSQAHHTLYAQPGRHVIAYANLLYASPQEHPLVLPQIPQDLYKINGISLQIKKKHSSEKVETLLIIAPAHASPILTLSPFKAMIFNHGADALENIHYRIELINSALTTLKTISAQQLYTMISNNPTGFVTCLSQALFIENALLLSIEKYIFQDIFFKLFENFAITHADNIICGLLEQDDHTIYKNYGQDLVVKIYTTFPPLSRLQILSTDNVITNF
ncbi:MAG: hypothetical protein US69_C0027G0010 [candidate division TM6 bacterium GW2011_GWF2_38_10]|nr:MAG: hypothetical protein US69_C0027G0010 [candidate division TM6 bacterium GW2011_GWF2_38_10]